jgi:hypothetical protein
LIVKDGMLVYKRGILAKEIELWKGFEYALREENRLLFHKMLSECNKKEYADCTNVRGQNFSGESLFLILILQQQKMIDGLVAKLRDKKVEKQ